MPRSTKVLAFCALVPAVVLSGCSDMYYDRRETIALSAGNAVAANQVVQMVDPWPRDSANRNIAFNGQKIQSAVERYRTNRVIPPVSAMTSSTQYQQAPAANAPQTSGAGNAPPPPPK